MSLGVVIVSSTILAVLAIYVGIMLVFFFTKSGPFTPYVRPEPPEPHFYPVGTVTPLTDQQIQARNDIIRKNLS